MHTSEYTAESNFSNFVIEYLGEIETEFENTLPCLSGAQMGSNQEKNWRSKISWHTPFKPWFILQNIPVDSMFKMYY